MKESLKLLPIFIILFLVVYLLFSTFAFIYQWLLTAPYAPAEAFGYTARLLPDILLNVLPAAVLFSLFALLFFRRYHRGRNLLAPLLVLLLSSAVYGGLFFYLSGLQTPEHGSSSFPPLHERQLHRFSDTMVYAEEVLPDARQERQLFQLDTLLTVSLQSDSLPRMELIGSGTADPTAGTITFSADRPPLEYQRHEAAGVVDLEPPPLLAGFFREIGALVTHLRGMLESSLALFAAAVAVQVLWAVSAWGLVRVSSWPLFNALLALLAFRGLFFLWQTFRSDIVTQVVEPLLEERAMPLVPVGAFLLLAVLMLAWTSVMRPRGEEG